MGDMGAYWRDIYGHSKTKRAGNRDKSAQYLMDAGIIFESKNMGAHIIVKSRDGLIDFWPGTGRWKTRKGKTGFGVRKLVNYIDSKVNRLK